MEKATIISLFLLISFGSIVFGYTIEVISTPFQHSECPIWENRINKLIFVDILKGGIYAYSPTSKDLRSINVTGTVAPLLPSVSNSSRFIIGLNRTISILNWDGESDSFSTETLTTLSEEIPTVRTNEGKADPAGRLLIGTMGYEDDDGNLDYDCGKLYIVTKENLNNPEIIIGPVNISNGLAWNKANDKLYYIDTPTRKIVEYNYSVETGKIVYSKIILNLNDYDITGNPDGMTIDEDDNLWVALYSGFSVIKVNSTTGEIMDIVELPVAHVTSVIFGGENLDILFVTSSQRFLTEAQLEEQSFAGCAFAVHGLGTKGLPLNRVNL